MSGKRDSQVNEILSMQLKISGPSYGEYIDNEHCKIYLLECIKYWSITELEGHSTDVLPY